ncbi:hypothetical protein LEMLEM_LOCUS18603 [Lemmus lemmus]
MEQWLTGKVSVQLTLVAAPWHLSVCTSSSQHSVLSSLPT